MSRTDYIIEQSSMSDLAYHLYYMNDNKIPTVMRCHSLGYQGFTEDVWGCLNHREVKITFSEPPFPVVPCQYLPMKGICKSFGRKKRKRGQFSLEADAVRYRAGLEFEVISG